MDGSTIDLDAFGIGQPVRRREDKRFVTGAGCFTDDINLPGQVYGHILRSPHAHARIRAIDTSAARAAPGVLGVYTIDDLDADGYGEIPTQAKVPGRAGSEMFAPTRPILARGVVRYVGNPVVYVVADSPAQAKEAAELIEVDYEDLPSVTDPREADKARAPLLYPEHGSNLCVHWESHEPAAVDAASPRRPRSSPSISSTTGLSAARWSHASRSASGIRKARATPSPRRPRA